MSLQVNNLIGFGAGGSSAGFTFIGSCNSVTSSLNFGSLSAGAVAAGDILVYCDHSVSASSPASVTPSGFTSVTTATSGGPALSKGHVSIKKATGSEGSVTGMAGDNPNKVGLVFRSNTPVTTITTGGANSEATSGNPGSQTCDPSAETVPVIVIGVASVEAATGAFSTASPAFDTTIANSDSDMLTGYKIYNAAPASHSIDMNDLGGENFLASFYFKIS